MHKLKLALDDLTVESFSTADERPVGGTIHARADSEDTCETCPGVWHTCGGGQDTCWDSCDGVCGTYFCGSGQSCEQQSCVYSCAWTACNNCQQTANEAGTCIAPCTVNC